MSKKPNNVIKYMVQGMEYQTPVVPEYSKIRNYGLDRKQQIWSRDLTYEQFDWDEGWEQRATMEQLIWLEEEIDRLYDGVWIFLNGKPTYFNNYIYFWLQWYTLESGDYPDFMDTCVEVYRFSEICDNAKLCLGYTLLKGRRMGASSMAASEMLLCALINRNSIEGIISKTGVDAQEVFDFVVNAYQSLPAFLKPRSEGGDSPKKVLSLKKQGEKTTKDKKIASTREGLNNKITWGANALNTFDGRKLLRAIVDEAGKFEDISIADYLQVVSKCVTRGAKVVGKIIMPTTVNPPNKGGNNFKAVWDGSDQHNANDLGQTKTGLYRIFVPAYMGYEGYIDFDGTSICNTPTPEQRAYLATVDSCPDPTIGSIEFLEKRRFLLKNDEVALAEEKRQSPFTPEEVFDAASNGCYFNTSELRSQEELIMALMDAEGRNTGDTTKEDCGRRGWFVPVGNNCMRFLDDPKGMWYVRELLPEEEANQFITQGQSISPANTAYGAAGLDPYAHESGVTGGSDAACIIRKRYNILSPKTSGYPVAMFLGRPPKKKFFFNQIANGLRYYGVKMLGERAPSDWVEWFEGQFLHGYLIGTEKKDGTKIYGLNAQDKALREAHLSEMIESSYQDHDKIWFLRLIRDRRAFDPLKRTKYDAAMADGMALLALKEPFLKKYQEKKKKKRFFRKGGVSVS